MNEILFGISESEKILLGTIEKRQYGPLKICSSPYLSSIFLVWRSALDMREVILDRRVDMDCEVGSWPCADTGATCIVVIFLESQGWVIAGLLGGFLAGFLRA